MNRKNAIAAVALSILTLAGSSRAAAQDPIDEDIKLFRKDLRSLRKQIIAANIRAIHAGTRGEAGYKVRADQGIRG